VEDAEARLVIESYRVDVYNASLRILGNAADAEDVTQDTFVSALQRMSTYDPAQAIGPWLRAIARNRSIDLLRRRARAPEPEPAPSQSVEAVAIERLEAERVRAALARLPDRDRAMLVLRYWEDQPVEAVARSLRMTDGAVRVALMRARRTLGAMLAMEESGVEV
jgi:RNA polymerase sigma-70 factor (ECF subfamily)